MIDAKKRALEAKNTADLNRIFKHLAEDAANIYLATNSVNAFNLSQNYRAEFLKEIRDIMRKTIKVFAFSLRQDLEAKHNLIFGVENKKLEIELDFKKVQEIENLTDSTLEQINNDFLLAASLFVANESEKQSDFITKTNEKEINTAFIAASTLFFSKLAKADAKEAEKLRKIEKTFIANEAKTSIIEKGKSRAALIAEQNIGMTEAWSRQKEAELINAAELITTTQKVVRITKSWNSTLDSKTRESHAAADGQEVPVNDYFIVGGEMLKAPRLGSIPSNNINCRCLAEYSF